MRCPRCGDTLLKVNHTEMECRSCTLCFFVDDIKDTGRKRKQ